MRVVVLAERKPHARRRRAGLRSERSSDDHLRGRESLLTLGKARRHRVPGRIEVRMLGVDARVDDPDLDSLARGVERRSPERGGADLLWRGGGLRRVAPGGQDVANAMQAAEACDVVSGQREREAVGDEPVAPPDSRRRDLRRELLAEGALLARRSALRFQGRARAAARTEAPRPPRSHRRARAGKACRSREGPPRRRPRRVRCGSSGSETTQS